MSEEYEIRPLRPGDEAALLATFEAVFGPRARRSSEEWRHLFEQNPAGRRAFVALRAGRVAAQYAALPERVWIDGQERVFAQIVDSMVHPEHRAGLKRPGLFVRTAEAFFAAYGGRERDLVHFGFPLPEPRRIGERFLDYRTVCTVLALARGVGGSPAGPASGVEVLAGPLGEEARWLWERCASEWGASAIRDERFLDWRFRTHPARRYRMLGARDAGGPLRGLAVIWCGDWTLPRSAVLADWLVPAGEGAVGEALLASVEAEARQAGSEAVLALLPEASAWFARFQEHGFRVHPTDYRLVARPFDPRFDEHWLREHWWWTLADTDLV